MGQLRRVNFEDKELFIEYLSQRLGLLTESYVVHPVSRITFSYIIKDGLASDNRRLLQDLTDKSLTTHRFNNLLLPISMDPNDYGTVLVHNLVVEGFNRFIVNSGTRNYQIDVSPDTLVNKVKILGAIDLSWVDTKLTDVSTLQDGYIIKREIGKSTMFFIDGVKVLSKKLLSAKPITKLATETSLKSKFVTMDIETVKINNKLTPYLICGYNGSKYITSYADESLNQSALFSSFINQLLTFFSGKSKSLTVYAHNFSSFDGLFLMKHLLHFGSVEPLLHNGKIITIKLKLTNGKTITFKDSMLLLPFSLRKLCLAFNISIGKGYFPFDLVNIFYKGLLPQIELWKDIPNNEYTSLIAEFTSKVWSFKDEAIKYCKLDCQALHQILVKFNELIFSNFKTNIHSSLTLPSLAMTIYRSQFMPKNSIYQILGKIDEDIRQSYTGGAVDVYIPHNRAGGYFSKIFNKLYYYDVNSLYPFIMSKTFMPVGKPVAFTGDIRKIDPNAYGFFYCKITSPDNLEHPILQRRIKTSNGMRTVAGLGSWTGWIFSGELDNAIKFGYKFEIIKGYEFEKGDIFSGYITKMYELRLKYPKSDPMNLIAKLLMNSLYGKFGMRMETTKVEMFNTNSETDNVLLEALVDGLGSTIKDFIQLDEYIVTVRDTLINYKYSEDEEMYHGADVNVAIASAVTGGARMWMSAFKNSSLSNLYYSDTDSIVVDKPLHDDLIGSSLGQLKLENVITKAVFLAPKVYGFITVDGQEVIKIKGLNNPELKFNFNELELLLVKDASKEFTQEKWFKKIIKGEIVEKEVAYNLKVTSNKRAPIYINNVFSNTKPYNYDEVSSDNNNN